MQIPLEITFRGVSRSDWSEHYIRSEAAHLERFADGIVSCRVAVERPQQHQQLGNPYRVRIELRLPPNKDLVVTREPQDEEMHAQLRTVIHSAFAAMQRQLTKTNAKRHGDVKEHYEEAPTALVVRCFREQGYGFIRTPEGREFYFHRNSVLHGDFDRLEVGTEVRFAAEMGDAGPQASTVQIVNKPGARASDDEAGAEVPRGWD